MKYCKYCKQILKVIIPYSELTWYKCVSCDRDLVIFHSAKGLKLEDLK